MLIPPRGGSLLDSSVRGGVGAAKIGAHCWTESIQIHGVNVGCYPSRYSEDFWRGTSGRGNGNCDIRARSLTKTTRLTILVR